MRPHPAAPAPAAFDARYRKPLTDLRVDFATLELPASQVPWTDTGLDVAEGDLVTSLAEGRIVTAEALGLVAGAKFHLWFRVGSDGPVWKGTQDTTTFRALRSGRLQVALCQGEWSTPVGDIETPPEVYAACEGALAVALVRWDDDPAHGALAGLHHVLEVTGGDSLARAELARLARPVERPEGWSYLWFLGESDTFTRADAGGREAIEVSTRDDAAILRHEIDLPVEADTTLSWSWRVDRLPSSLSEDALLQHDYLSIAVEYDCGRDITYMWSTDLDEGHVFTCPIPQWAPRETHVVVRSGAKDLDRWVSEERRLADDYRRILKDEPGRIVAVWLIAVSVFQHGEGHGWFADMAIESGGRRYDVR